MNRAEFLDRAKEAITGDRAVSHGESIEDSFGKLSSMWSAYLGATITPVQAAQMLVLLKICRSSSGDATHEDHYLDAVGYSALAGELATDTAASAARMQTHANLDIAAQCINPGASGRVGTPEKAHTLRVGDRVRLKTPMRIVQGSLVYERGTGVIAYVPSPDLFVVDFEITPHNFESRRVFRKQIEGL